jgi:hypothetical protein
MPTKDSSFVRNLICPASSKKDGVEQVNATWVNGRPLARTVTHTRTGVRVPRWKEKIEKNEDATSNMSAVYDTFRYNTAYWTTFIGPDSFGSTWSSIVYGPVPMNNGQLDRTIKPLTIGTSSTDNFARAKFYKALRKRAVQMSGPTFLGELRETMHMLHRPAQSLWSSSKGYLDAISKEKRRNPKHWTKALSGLWLEYSFGWVPLLSDAKDAAAAWDRIGQNPKFDIVNVSYKDTVDTTSSLGTTYDNNVHPIGGTGNIRCRTESRWKQEVNVRYKAKLRSQVGMTTWDNFALFGFTPSEFVPTAWELLPWSFLVDYFTNIGDILTSVVTSDSDVVFTVRTIRTFSSYYGKAWNDIASLKASLGATPCSGAGNPVNWELNRKTIDRAKIGAVPLPSFQLKFNLGDGQLGNIAALLSQSRGLHPQNPRYRYRGIPY